MSTEYKKTCKRCKATKKGKLPNNIEPMDYIPNPCSCKNAKYKIETVREFGRKKRKQQVAMRHR